MRLNAEHLLAALRACPSLVDEHGVESDEYRDLCACVEIARTCGAFEEKQVTQSPPCALVYGDWLFYEQEQYEQEKTGGDAIADIDAGVDDVFDKEEER